MNVSLGSLRPGDAFITPGGGTVGHVRDAESEAGWVAVTLSGSAVTGDAMLRAGTQVERLAQDTPQ